jgi:hypothetical protein
MPNYGLVTDVKKYGTGSLRLPFNTTENKALRIDPQGSTTFSIASGEDFYISAWIRYSETNVATVGAKYPIIRFGRPFDNQAPYGWEIGFRVLNIGGNTPLPYFAYNNQVINTTFDGSNGNQISPSTGNFDHYEVYRINGELTLKFTNSSNIANTTTVTYTGAIASLASTFHTNAIFVGSEQPYVANLENAAYVDELFFAKSISAVQSTKPTGEIDDGALETTQLLLHFNSSLKDDTGPTLFQASLSAQTQVTALAERYKVGASAVTAQTQLACSATRIVSTQPIVIAVTALATLQATATRIKQFSISITAFATEVAVGTKIKTAAASLSTQVRVTAIPDRWYPRPYGTWTATISDLPSTYTNWNYLEVTGLMLTPYSQAQSRSHTLFTVAGQTVVRRYTVGPTRNYLDIGGVTLDISGLVPTSGTVSMKLRVIRGQAVQVDISGSTYSFGVWDFDLAGASIVTNTVNISGASITANLFNLYIAKTNYASEIITTGTQPWTFNDQQRVLGYYPTFGAVDFTGVSGQAQAALAAQFALGIQAQILRLAQAQLNTQTQTTIQAVKTARTGSDLSSQVTVIATIQKVIPASAQLNSQVTMTVSAVKRTTTMSTIATAVALTSAVVRTARAQAQITAFATQVTLDVAFIQAQAQLQVTAQLTAQPDNRTRNQSAALSTQVTLAAAASRQRSTTAAISAQVVTQVAAVRTLTTTIAIQTQVSVTTLAYVLTSDNIQLNTSSALTAEVKRSATTQVAITARFTQVSNLGKLRFFQANMSAFVTQVSVVSGYQIDIRTTVYVLPESRQLLVLPENRITYVLTETNLLQVQPEDRLYTIKPQSRVNKIRGNQK